MSDGSKGIEPDRPASEDSRSPDGLADAAGECIRRLVADLTAIRCETWLLIGSEIVVRVLVPPAVRAEDATEGVAADPRTAADDGGM